MTFALTRHVPLPFQASPPWCLSRVGRHLHLVAADLEHGDIRHAVLGAGGRGWVGECTPLPLDYPTGLSGCSRGLLVTGAALGSEAPVILGLTEGAAVLSQARLPVKGDLLRWPVPLQIGDRDYALWEEYVGGGTAVASCRVESDRTFKVSRHQFPIFGDRTAIGVIGDRMLMARVDPVSEDVCLFLLDEDLRSISTATIAEGGNAVAVSPAHDGAVVAWSDGRGRICLRWFSPELSIYGQVLTVTQVDAPTTVAGLKLASSGSATVVLYRTLTLNDPRIVEGGPTPVLDELRGTAREAVALVNLAASTITDPIWLDPPSAGAVTAEWLGPDVWILHGAAEPVISQISTGAR
jgi:hypothetical protein